MARKEMTFKEKLMQRLDQHRVRIEYFNQLKSLMRTMPGSEIVMDTERSYVTTWPVYKLVRNKQILAEVSTSGSVFLNHWFRDGKDC